jgi:hypothetical protein
LEGDYNKTPEARLADIENCLAQKVHAFKHWRVINKTSEWPITDSREYEYAIFELMRI